MLNRTSLETVEYRIQIIIPVQTIQITTTPFPMSKGWNRWRYTRFPVRGGRQIPGPTGNSSLFVVFGVRGLGTSRGKERRRTSRPTNLHIWLRVATAPIGIAKSQIGLVRGPDPLRRPSPLIRRRRFSWKSISRQAFRYVTFPSTRSRCLVILIHGIMRPEGCLTGCNNNLGIQQMLRLLFEYVFAFCRKKRKKKGKSFSHFSFVRCLQIAKLGEFRG